MVTVTDKRLQHQNGTTVDYYMTDVATAQEYYSFGALMPARTYAATGKVYRYGFNGKENDNEVKGVGNQLDLGDRIYDPKIGRWFSLYPNQQKYPSISPYDFSFDNSILFNDPDGRDPIITITSYNSKQVRGKTIINVTLDVTIRAKVINNSSSNINLKELATYANERGAGILSGSGTINSNEIFKFDGKGGVNKSPKNVQINYIINVKVDIEVAKNVSDVHKNDDVILFQDNLNKFKIQANRVKDAVGVNDHTMVMGAIPKINNFKNAGVALHELMHSYGLADMYKVDANRHVTSEGLGNLMGVQQQVNFTTITQTQKNEFVLDVLQIRESMKYNKTDYSGLKPGTHDARKDLKTKTE